MRLPMGGMELLVILVIILVLFGPKQLPKLGKMFGQTMKSIREGAEGELGDDEEKDEAKAKEESKA